jgi:hypothetical protein
LTTGKETPLPLEKTSCHWGRLAAVTTPMDPVMNGVFQALNAVDAAAAANATVIVSFSFLSSVVDCLLQKSVTDVTLESLTGLACSLSLLSTIKP